MIFVPAGPLGQIILQAVEGRSPAEIFGAEAAEAVIEAFYHRCRGRLLERATYKTGNVSGLADPDDAAQDLVSAVWIQLWRKFAGMTVQEVVAFYQGDGQTVSYLYRILDSRFVDLVRRRRSGGRSSFIPIDELPVLDAKHLAEPATVEDNLVERERRDALRAEMDLAVQEVLESIESEASPKLKATAGRDQEILQLLKEAADKGEELTNVEVAGRYGVTEQRACQLIKRVKKFAAGKLVRYRDRLTDRD